MSESLKLVGFKRILNHSTDDGSDTQLSLVPPPKGNAHFVARWWDKKANQKIYISCTKLAIAGSDLEIVVPSSFSTRLQITYTGDVAALIFGTRMDVTRVALIDKNTGEVAVQYIFPSIKNRTAKIKTVVNDDYAFPAPEPEGPEGGDGGDGGEEFTVEQAAPKKKKKAKVTVEPPA